jgi:ABC-2 type transport system permease protein
MKLYARYFSMQLKSQLEYKASFLMTVLGQFLISFTTFLSVYFMFSRFHSVEGFTFSEVLLCFSIVLMAYSSAECFVRGFDVFQRLIQSGDLDRILVRPRSIVFQVLTSNIEFSRLGRFFQAVLMLAYAIPNCGVAWTWDKVLTLVSMILGGFGIYTALFMLHAAISFFTIEGLEFMNIFTDGSREFGKYPLSVYGKGVLKFMTYVIPFALVQYYPFLYLVGQTERSWYMILPLVAGLFMIPCAIFFRVGLRKYQSTGS